jgi:hypothetical protein
VVVLVPERARWLLVPPPREARRKPVMPTQQLARTLEWGPANHDPENPFGHPATQVALDHRDADADQLDDN